MQILFVEDDPMNRRVVRDMLSVAGAEMAEAADAETGLAMIETGSYGIILMDLRMPGMDGLTAIRRHGADPDHRGDGGCGGGLARQLPGRGGGRGVAEAGGDERAVRCDRAHAGQGQQRRRDVVVTPFDRCGGTGPRLWPARVI
jgi:CheY-like chemotaxis protein